jgi:hypothetical protein
VNDGDADPSIRIRAELEALPDQEDDQLPAAQVSMRSAKRAALDDLTRFERDRTTPHDRRGTTRWLTYTIARYQGWIKRLAQ